MPNIYRVQDYERDLLGRFMAFHTMVREYVLSSAHNFNFAPEFAIFFFLSYFVAQEASVAPIVLTIRHVIQINGLVSSSSPITKARGV
jgi:hypothetical protein